VEREKERELILSGKMSMADSHWKDDPVLKLHRDLDKVQRKVSKGQQVSISPTFYEQLFHIKVFFATFLFLQFGFVIFFWQENIGAKAVCKMLAKLTTATATASAT